MGKCFEDSETILSCLCRSGTTWSFIFRQILNNRICQRWVVIFTFQPFSLRWLRQRRPWAWVFPGPAWTYGVEKYSYPCRELNPGHPVYFLTDIFQLVKILWNFSLIFGLLKIVLGAYNYWEVWSCLFGRSDLCASKFLIRFSAMSGLEQTLYLGISKYLHFLRFLKLLAFQLPEGKVMVWKSSNLHKPYHVTISVLTNLTYHKKLLSIVRQKHRPTLCSYCCNVSMLWWYV